MCWPSFEIPTLRVTKSFFFLFLWPLVGPWRSKLPPLKTAHTHMGFCLHPFNNISENSKQQINSKNVFLSIFVIFYAFWQVSHISADWFQNHNEKQKSDLRKSNQLCTLFFSGRALFSFLALKGFEIDNYFKHFNYLSAMKLFLSNINSFWSSYVNGDSRVL